MSNQICDTNADFVAAVSMLAALEGACSRGDDTASQMLPYLGMARSELTDYGQRLPTHLEAITLDSFAEGLTELQDLLFRMLAASTDLTLTLRLHAAQQILREGTERSGRAGCGVRGPQPDLASSFPRHSGCTLLECGPRGRHNGEVSG